MKNTDFNQDIYKTVQIGDDTYRIRKFTARDGLKLARLVLAKAAPLLPMLRDSDEDNPDNLYSALGEVLNALDDKDMDLLMDKCLRVCSKMLPAGPQEVIDGMGHYGVPEVEYDMALTFRLIVEAIRWGAADFFGESGLNLQALGLDGKSPNP